MTYIDRKSALLANIRALPSPWQQQAAMWALKHIKVGEFQLDNLITDNAVFPENLSMRVSWPDGVHPQRGIKVELMRGDIAVVSRSSMNATQLGAEELARQFCTDLVIRAVMPRDDFRDGGA